MAYEARAQRKQWLFRDKEQRYLSEFVGNFSFFVKQRPSNSRMMKGTMVF